MRKLDVWGNTVNIIHNINIPRDCWPCAWLASRPTKGLPFLSWFRVVFPRTETNRSHRSRAGIPSYLNPASKEMISNSVELCETAICFLHIQLIGTNAWLPTTHNVPPEVDFWFVKISRKIGVLKQSEPALFCSVSHMTTLFVITWLMNVRDQTIQSFVTSFGQLRNRPCKLIQRFSGLPIRANHKQFRIIWEDTFGNSPKVFNSSSLKWWSSMHGADTL